MPDSFALLQSCCSSMLSEWEWGRVAVHTVRMSNLLLGVTIFRFTGCLPFCFLWLKIATENCISFNFVCIPFVVVPLLLFSIFVLQKSIGILICFGNTRRFRFRKNKTPKQARWSKCCSAVLFWAIRARHARISNSIVYILLCSAFELQRLVAVVVGHWLWLCVFKWTPFI